MFNITETLWNNIVDLLCLNKYFIFPILNKRVKFKSNIVLAFNQIYLERYQIFVACHQILLAENQIFQLYSNYRVTHIFKIRYF